MWLFPSVPEMTTYLYLICRCWVPQDLQHGFYLAHLFQEASGQSGSLPTSLTVNSPDQWSHTLEQFPCCGPAHLSASSGHSSGAVPKPSPQLRSFIPCPTALLPKHASTHAHTSTTAISNALPAPGSLCKLNHCKSFEAQGYAAFSSLSLYRDKVLKDFGGNVYPL